MTEFTNQQLLAIIDRSLKATAAQFKIKKRRRKAKSAASRRRARRRKA
jgi:hypothetical protein